MLVCIFMPLPTYIGEGGTMHVLGLTTGCVRRFCLRGGSLSVSLSVISHYPDKKLKKVAVSSQPGSAITDRQTNSFPCKQNLPTNPAGNPGTCRWVTACGILSILNAFTSCVSVCLSVLFAYAPLKAKDAICNPVVMSVCL